MTVLWWLAGGFTAFFLVVVGVAAVVDDALDFFLSSGDPECGGVFGSSCQDREILGRARELGAKRGIGRC